MENQDTKILRAAMEQFNKKIPPPQVTLHPFNQVVINPLS